MCICAPQAVLTAEGAESPGTPVTDVCELPYQCWGPNLGPLEEPMLLTTETSLQPLKYFL